MLERLPRMRADADRARSPDRRDAHEQQQNADKQRKPPPEADHAQVHADRIRGATRSASPKNRNAESESAKASPRTLERTKARRGVRLAIHLKLRDRVRTAADGQ